MGGHVKPQGKAAAAKLQTNATDEDWKNSNVEKFEAKSRECVN